MRGWQIFKTPWLRGVLRREGEGGWNPCFSRAFNDWEVQEAETFLERLNGKRVRRDVEDMVFWTESNLIINKNMNSKEILIESFSRSI